jgi:hypothetical protein
MSCHGSGCALMPLVQGPGGNNGCYACGYVFYEVHQETVLYCSIQTM